MSGGSAENGSAENGSVENSSVGGDIPEALNQLGHFYGMWKQLTKDGRDEALYYFVPIEMLSDYKELDEYGPYRTSLPKGVVSVGEEEFPGSDADFSTLLELAKEYKETGKMTF